jgi:hypothetical protein
MYVKQLFLAMSFLVGGCATGPRFEDYGTAIFLGLSSDFDATIEEIDGDRAAWPFVRESCVAPGVHRVKVSTRFGSRPARYACAYLDFRFEAGRRYKMRASRSDGVFHFRLLDITEGGWKTQLLAFDGETCNTGRSR